MQALKSSPRQRDNGGHAPFAFNELSAHPRRWAQRRDISGKETNGDAVTAISSDEGGCYNITLR